MKSAASTSRLPSNGATGADPVSCDAPEPMQSLPEPRPTRTPRACSFVAVLLTAAACGGGGPAADASLVHTVMREDLHVTVRERAQLKAATDTRVASMLEGRSTLIYLIAEGSVVRPGDRVAELDASAIEEKRATQAISVAKADATLRQARKNLEVMEKELLAAERTASSRLQIARIRLAKFLGQASSGARAEAAPRDADAGPVRDGTNRDMLARLEELIASEGLEQLLAEARPNDVVDRVRELLEREQAVELEMGEMANQILTLVDEMGLARADYALANDTLTHSQDLAAKGFVTRNELERDRINHRRQQSRVTVAWNNLQLLVKFTLHETLIGLKQEVDNAELGLASVLAANEARRVQQAAELASAEAEYTLAKERLDNWNQQVQNAVLRAPSEGLVVYSRYDWDEVVHEGMEVRQGQDIVFLPDIRRMVAELKVHEAQIDKVRVGQRASVKIDAFPDRILGATVATVSSLPDPSRRSTEVKVYTVTVALDGVNADGAIRPGMNATVEVEVGVLEDVVQVPLPSLERSGDRHYVWKVTPGGAVAAEVRLGGSNLTHVEIVSGLVAGDRIHLVRPAGAVLPDPEPRAPAPEASEGEASESEAPGSDPSGGAPVGEAESEAGSSEALPAGSGG